MQPPPPPNKYNFFYVLFSFRAKPKKNMAFPHQTNKTQLFSSTNKHVHINKTTLVSMIKLTKKPSSDLLSYSTAENKLEAKEKEKRKKKITGYTLKNQHPWYYLTSS